MQYMNKELRQIKGYEGYFVTRDGRVMSSLVQVSPGGHAQGFKTKVSDSSFRELKPSLYAGYKGVMLYKNKKPRRGMVHRLVLETWGDPKTSQLQVYVRHLNGNKLDNRIENLCWGTARENKQDDIKNKVLPHGERHHATKLTSDDVLFIRSQRMRYGLYGELSKHFKMSKSAIGKIWRGETWTYLEK